MGVLLHMTQIIRIKSGSKVIRKDIFDVLAVLDVPIAAFFWSAAIPGGGSELL